MSLPARNHSQSLGRTHPSLPEPRRCAGSSPGCDQQLPERPVGGRIHQDMRSSPGSTGGSGRSCCQPRSRARSALPVLCRGRHRIKPPQTGQGNARNGHGNPHGKLRSGFTTERRSKNRSEGAAAAEAVLGKRGSGIPAASRRDGSRARLLGEHLPDFFMCLAPGRCQMRELRAGHSERGVAALPARPWHPEQPQGREDARKGLCDFGGVLASHRRSKPLCPGGFCLGEILGYIEFARFNPEFWPWTRNPRHAGLVEAEERAGKVRE